MYDLELPKQRDSLARSGTGCGPTGAATVSPIAREAAGVAFSADPVTGRRDEIVITAARGLGERVVSGVSVVDEWVVRDGTAVCLRSVEAAITAEQAVEIAGLARRAEAHFSAVPQDVE